VPTYIALLRAVNVGGRSYRMADLREHLTESGLSDVETYIQSGNVRFRTPMRSPAKVERHCEEVLSRHSGFEVPAVLLTAAELTAIHADALRLVEGQPGVEGARCYVSFFKEGAAPTGDEARRIEAWDAPGEVARVAGRAVHVWLDHRMSDAGFFPAFRRPLAAGTVRDLTVVRALVERWGG